jgi:hypothetical protein
MVCAQFLWIFDSWRQCSTVRMYHEIVASCLKIFGATLWMVKRKWGMPYITRYSCSLECPFVSRRFPGVYSFFIAYIFSLELYGDLMDDLDCRKIIIMPIPFFVWNDYFRLTLPKLLCFCTRKQCKIGIGFLWFRIGSSGVPWRKRQWILDFM